MSTQSWQEVPWIYVMYSRILHVLTSLMWPEFFGNRGVPIRGGQLVCTWCTTHNPIQLPLVFIQISKYWRYFTNYSLNNSQLNQPSNVLDVKNDYQTCLWCLFGHWEYVSLNKCLKWQLLWIVHQTWITYYVTRDGENPYQRLSADIHMVTVVLNTCSNNWVPIQLVLKDKNTAVYCKFINVRGD